MGKGEGKRGKREREGGEDRGGKEEEEREEEGEEGRDNCCCLKHTNLSPPMRRVMSFGCRL